MITYYVPVPRARSQSVVESQTPAFNISVEKVDRGGVPRYRIVYVQFISGVAMGFSFDNVIERN